MSKSSDQFKPDSQKPARIDGFSIKSVFLFTESDFKTVLLPQGVFALSIVSAKYRISENLTQPTPDKVLLWLPLITVWIWVHLVVAGTSNRSLPESKLEDQINKAQRPVRTVKLTSMETLTTLRTVVILSMGMSLVFNSYLPSIIFMILLWVYNDLVRNNAGPWTRNGLNALGMACFNWGAARTFLGSEASKNEKVLGNWYVLMAAIAMTTIHTQVFPDVAGDEGQGRKTMSSVYGEAFPRWSIASFVMAWSLICLKLWNVSSWVACLSSVGLGAIISALVLLRLGRLSDGWAWRLWCYWVITLYLQPVA
ncbi:hypothetical protein F5B19DRAFT_479645 [Rostrohypoxylon terebratum]|nr:hypothetical protein F5B19DRAFT_479645 [Rostrohypoxylon terebratum]